MKKKMLICLLLLAGMAAQAQELKVVKEMEMLMDVYAQKHPVYMNDTALCAVIRVSLLVPEVRFSGPLVDKNAIWTAGEYIVYVGPGCKRLILKSEAFLEKTYDFPSPAEAGTTYGLQLALPENSASVVRIRTNAKNAQLQMAGQTYDTETGVFEVRVPKGEYDYELTSTQPGFTSAQGKIDVNDIFVMKRVELPTEKRFKLSVKADDNAKITIDGVEQKKKGSFQTDLPAGLHTVQANAGDRWLPKRVEVDMTNGNASADMSMRGNLKIVYPSNAQFEITPLNNALPPAKKTIKTGEVISLLGDYDIKVVKKNYEATHANVFINTNADVDNFRIEVTSKGDNYFYGINGTSQDYRKAVKEYEKMAKKGDEIAQYKLAYCYEHGYGGMINLAKAREYYGLASKAGNPDATYSLAYLTTDSRTRAELYIKAANLGNLKSMQIAGDYFMQLKDYASALKYYTMATTEGDSKRTVASTDIKGACLASIGEIYYNGYGVKKDMQRAWQYFDEASDMGNTQVDERLADYYFYGYNGKPDKATAIKMYERIGDKLSNDAKLRVALYEYDNQNYKKANIFFSKLMTSNVKYPNDIGEVFYRMGGEVYNVDMPASFYYYSTARNYGVMKPRQMVRLGYMYLNGKGTGVDDSKAFECFEKASQLNDSEGTCMLGYMYEKGKGVGKSPQMAIALYEKAGKAGFLKAYNNLGTVYASQKDMDKAAYYWELAAKAGNKKAVNNLITYYKNRRNTEKEAYWRTQLSKLK